MANSIKYKELSFNIGDMLDIFYKIKEGEKERIQKFTGMLIKFRGVNDAVRMITTRRITRSGIGVERIIPLASPFISDIKLSKKGHYTKAKAYFVRGLSDQNLRRKIFKHSKTHSS